MTQTAQTKILITGFGPFPGVPHNVSSDIAERCAAQWSARTDVEAQFLPLTTDWTIAPERAVQRIAKSRPDIIIHLGVSERACGLVLETRAYNECYASPDVDGTVPSATRLKPEAPADVSSTAPIAEINQRLVDAGVPVTISNDPGRYLCNAVYHETLSHQSGNQAQAMVIFIHIPVAPGPGTITEEDILAGLDIVLAVMKDR